MVSIFDCERMSDMWAKVTAKKLGITDATQIANLKSYYKENCDKKTEQNYRSKLELIAQGKVTPRV